MSFVKIPNLPELPVKYLLLGQKYAKILNTPLISRGICPIYVPDNPLVDPRLSGHADLSVLHLGGNRAAVSPYLLAAPFAGQLSELGMELTAARSVQCPEYPNDAGLNVCRVGGFLIFDPHTADACVTELWRELTPVECRQGYSRCSVCVVDGCSIITADPGIAAAARRAGIAFHEVRPGLAGLEGFGQGFIGGAAFRLGGGILAFTGRISDAEERAGIENFIGERGLRADYLTDGPLIDIGGAIPLTEQPAAV